LKQKSEKLRSNSGFNFKLRRYTLAASPVLQEVLAVLRARDWVVPVPLPAERG
jgi:hypothetical protein